MDWPTWKPLYEAILQDFGYDRAADESARDALDALLADKLVPSLDDLRLVLAGKEVWLVGGAARGDDLKLVPLDAPTLVTDGAAALAVPRLRPTAIVTDLDGDVIVQAAANAVGIPLFVHAHGDNLAALKLHVPHFVGPLVGTTQAEPRGRVLDFGGFTDGDRAACIADALGARSLVLVGFDFGTPAKKAGGDPAVKRRKLAWARRVMDALPIPWRHAEATARS